MKIWRDHFLIKVGLFLFNPGSFITKVKSLTLIPVDHTLAR